MTKNKIVAEFMGIKTVQHDHWAYGEVTAIAHQGIIDLPLLIYEPDKDYNHLHEAWVKFRDLKFTDCEFVWQNRERFYRHKDYVFAIGEAMLKGTITEAFEELIKGIEWYASIVHGDKT